MTNYHRTFCASCEAYTVHAEDNSGLYCVHCVTHPKTKEHCIPFYFRGHTFRLTLVEADSLAHQLSSEIMDYKLKEAEQAFREVKHDH